MMPAERRGERGASAGPRRVLVTGASRGIGAAIARALAVAGFDLAVNYRRSKDEADVVVADIAAAGGTAVTLAFDVADRAACAEAIGSDIEANGAYYGAVHCAGVHADAAFPGMSPDVWDRVLRTNLDSFYNVLHPLVMPMVRARNGGRIVTISSCLRRDMARFCQNWLRSIPRTASAMASVACVSHCDCMSVSAANRQSSVTPTTFSLAIRGVVST